VIYLVTLERRPVRAMPKFVRAIQDNSDSYWKAMTNVWLVDTPLTARALTKALGECITPHDLLLVIQAQEEFSGRLTKSTWNWLRASRDNGDFNDE